VRMRFAASCLLVISGFFGGSVLAAEDSSAASVQRGPDLVVAQQPVSTVPSLPGVTAPRFSTIPPLPPTATPVLPATPTRPPVSTPPQPTRIVPAAPAVSPLQPVPTIPASSSTAPRAGGFPTEVALLVLSGSVTALGGGLYLLARSRTR
jgi:hypothetical protein